MPKLARTSFANRVDRADSVTADQVLRLACEHVALAAEAASKLREHAGEHDLLRAWHAGRIAANGRTVGSPPLRWSFHGIGVKAQFDGQEVNFDFGPDGTTDFLRPWDIYLAAEQKYLAWPFPAIQPLMEELVERGALERCDSSFTPPYRLVTW